MIRQSINENEIDFLERNQKNIDILNGALGYIPLTNELELL